jgi:hypothetical protein
MGRPGSRTVVAASVRQFFRRCPASMPLSIRGQKEVLVNATLPTLGTAATVLGVELTGTLWSSSKWTSHFTFEHLEISACEQSEAPARSTG